MGIVCGIPAVLAAWALRGLDRQPHLRRRTAGHGRGGGGGQGRGRPPSSARDRHGAARAAGLARHGPRHHRYAAGPHPRGDLLLHRPGPLHRCRSVIEFFGHPFVALTIALFLAYYLLGIRRGWSRKSLETVSTASLKPVGNILLVVGAGGIFGAVLKASGVAQALSDTFNDVGLPVIVLAYLISRGAAGRPGLGDGRDRHHGGHRASAGRGRRPLAGLPGPGHHGDLGGLDLRLARQRRRLLDGREVLRHLRAGHAEVLDGAGVGAVGGGVRGGGGAEPGRVSGAVRNRR